MGVGARNDLGGHQSFARKMTWKLPDESIFFSVQIEVTSKKKKKKKGLHSNWAAFSVQIVVTSKKKKKRSSLKLSRFFCPDCGNLQKKKIFTHLETVFVSSVRNILRSKLTQTTWNCPKFWRNIAQKIWNCPKFWRKIAQNTCNCPKFGHLTPTGGGPVPPGPPTSYAYGQGQEGSLC